ncbi:hypothetical protein JD969_08320 [Planctomycetota bacterium]|nr:hypothetical protein JD969_08320 [Planctomycetota bacterium]
MDIFQFGLLVALGLFILWRGGVIWKRGAKGFSIAMFVLAAFVFYEAGRIYFTQPDETPEGGQIITQPETVDEAKPAELDEKPTGLEEGSQPDETKINNNKQYMSAPVTDENGDTGNQ